MKKITLGTLLVASACLGANEVNSFEEMFTNATVDGTIRYYYIQTDKDQYSGTGSSASSNSLGGKLGFETAKLKGFNAKVTFMTTNGFFLDSDVNKVDTSLLGKDNGVYYNDPSKAKDSFSILGEAYIEYNYENLTFTFGREVIHSPFVDAKDVRMIPSAVQGFFVDYKVNDAWSIGVADLDKFKQRTSDRFTGMIEHALGNDTKLVTGSTTGNVYMANAVYNADGLNLKAYEYYAEDFMNSFYIDAALSQNIGDIKATFAAQYMNQFSIGNADNYFGANPSYAGGKINVNAFGLKASGKLDESTFVIAYSKTLRDSGSHDSFVLPWDGTPLFTNTITSNDLFQSVYGAALKSDSTYIGGSQGIKLAYSQGFDFTGVKGFSTTLAFLHTSNSRAGFDKDQKDYNIVLGYKHDKHFSLALKGILVDNNTGAAKDGTVTQTKQLTQYRVIANYQF